MASIVDRIVSAITYFTFGIFGIIWLVFVVVAKKPMTKFATFNIFQSCLISVLLALIGLAFDLILKISHVIPFLGNIISSIDIFINRTPIYFGYSISGLIITILIGYLIIFSLIGKKPFVPFVSSIIENNIGV